MFDFNTINYAELLFIAGATFAGVYLAYFLENKRNKNEREKTYKRLLKALITELEQNEAQLPNIKDGLKSYPVSLEIMKVFLGNVLVYEFASEGSIDYLWKTLHCYRSLSRSLEGGVVDKTDIDNATDSINKFYASIDYPNLNSTSFSVKLKKFFQTHLKKMKN